LASPPDQRAGGGEQDGQGPTAAPHRRPGSATTGTARPLLDPRFAPDMLCPCKILLGVAMRLRRRHFLHLIAGAVGLFRRNEDNPMLRRMMSGATIVATALWTAGVACALEDAQKYPDWKGQWNRAPTGVGGQPQPPFDPSKPWGLGQEAPFTPEYQAIYEANLADQAAGGSGLNGASCRAHGIPMT